MGEKDLLQGYEVCDLSIGDLLCPAGADEKTKAEIIKEWKKIVKAYKKAGRKLDGNELLKLYVVIDSNKQAKYIVPNTMGELVNLGEVSPYYCKPDSRDISGTISATLARFKFSGYGALDVKIFSNENPFQMVIVKEIEEHGKKKSVFVNKYFHPQSVNDFEIILDDPKYCNGYNTYVATILSEYGDKVDYSISVSEHMDYGVNEWGGIWCIKKDSVCTDWTEVDGNRYFDYDKILYRWCINKEDIAGIRVILQQIFYYYDDLLNNKDKSLLGTISKYAKTVFSPGNIMSMESTVIIGLAELSVEAGIAAGILLTILFAFVPGWDDIKEDQIKYMKEQIRTLRDQMCAFAHDTSNGKETEFENGVYIDFCCKQEIETDLDSERGIQFYEVLSPHYTVSTWLDDKDGAMYGPEGYVGKLYEDGTAWKKTAAQENGKRNYSKDFGEKLFAILADGANKKNSDSVKCDNYIVRNESFKKGKSIKPSGVRIYVTDICDTALELKEKIFNLKYVSENDNVSVHAIINYDDGKIIQTLPWEYKGKHHFTDLDETNIGIVICKQNDENKMRCTYRSLIALVAWLCALYGIVPDNNNIKLVYYDGDECDASLYWKSFYPNENFYNNVRNAMGEGMIGVNIEEYY